jgi:glycosyltransferase involved in cell wall biosynthesis
MSKPAVLVAVLIPCYNEEKSVAKVVKDFHKVLPQASIHVFDNNSSDTTAQKAQEAGAIVHFVGLPGKGNVVRRMFADVDADVYVMVDGDATYDAASSPKLIQTLIEKNLDMVVGCRVEDSSDNNNYRPGHRIGNKLLTGLVQGIFKGDFTDMLSGYRAYSRRFVKSFPAISNNFETETEMTVFTLEMRLPHGEVMTPYYERIEGSESKLSTYKDGLRVVKMILKLYSSERPLQFWGSIGLVLVAIAILLSIPVGLQYLHTHQVQRFPTLIIASAITLAGFMSFVIGVVLRTVTRGRNDAKHLTYLSIPAVKDN